MTRLQQSVGILAGLVLILMALSFWGGAHASAPPKQLSVVFVGMTNSPVPQMRPTRIEVCQGATGLCAMFWVSNSCATESIWFETDSVEQKTETGWQHVVPSGLSWSGVEGSVWFPGYGCLYAVGWPPGLPTNATWRLQVCSGREPSGLRQLVNEKIGRRIFRSGGGNAIVLSTEVRQ